MKDKEKQFKKRCEMIVSSCDLREEHRIVRCEPGNCETCERVFNWTKQVRKETAEKIFKDLKLLVPDNALGIVTRYFKEILNVEIKE